MYERPKGVSDESERDTERGGFSSKIAGERSDSISLIKRTPGVWAIVIPSLLKQPELSTVETQTPK